MTALNNIMSQTLCSTVIDIRSRTQESVLNRALTSVREQTGAFHPKPNMTLHLREVKESVISQIRRPR
jgi:hypothetical protein